MEAVDVFLRIDRVENALLSIGAHTRRQWRLHQDGVDCLVSVQPAHEREGLVQCRGVVEAKELSAAAGVADGLDLVADVDFRSGIAPGQHHAQPRRAALARGERANARRDVFTNACGAGHTV
jgi:hypothetical protein